MNGFAPMVEAINLARKGLGHTRPNPPVGAVIVRGEQIIGRGYHRRAGMPHAEVEAIKSAKVPLKDATLFVTLEPCSKPGRVGACTDAIIAAGIKRVVYAVEDPNPVNRGRAKAVLKAAGIRCQKFESAYNNMVGPYVTREYMDQILQSAENLVVPFAKHIETGRPFVTVKIAMSLDGKTHDDFGNARWVSSEKAREITGRQRNCVDAIMVGGATIREDDPVLLPHEGINRDLIRVVISKSGNLPRDAKVFTEGENETLVFPDPETALDELGKRGLLHVVCEGGMKLATYLAQAGLVDEWYAVLSNKVIGSRPIGEAVEIPRFICLRD